MITILWPTIRPQMMIKTYLHWISKSNNPKSILLTIAVNTEKEKDEILRSIPGTEIIVVGTKRGLTTAVNALSNSVNVLSNSDIIILSSDDMYAPADWDTWVISQLRGKTGCLRVNDGYIKQPSITIPIMTISCLRKLNYIIYHSSYIHQYSDTELYHNLVEIGLLIDMWDRSPIFEHRNWACEKRKPDKHDEYNISTVKRDAANWNKRIKLPIGQRLIR